VQVNLEREIYYSLATTALASLTSATLTGFLGGNDEKE
jgi:hypothetical protein